jgi:hypothetical protein
MPEVIPGRLQHLPALVLLEKQVIVGRDSDKVPPSMSRSRWCVNFGSSVLEGREEVPKGYVIHRRPQFQLFRGVVIQILPEPSLNFCHAHPLAFVIVGDLIAIDLSQAEIPRFRVGEVEPAHTRAGPHRK